MSINRIVISAILISGMFVVVPADAQIEINLDLVADGLTAPLFLTHAGDGSGRLFIVDQPGQIRVVQNGVLLAAPFLDITSKTLAVNAFFDERGLLGLAFHPDYANNGRFFIRYSKPRVGDPAEPCNDPGGFIVGAIFALGLFGVGEERALAMVFTMRIGTMISVAAFGAFSLWRSGLALADLPGRREELHERT